MVKVLFIGEYPIGEVLDKFQRFGSKVDKPEAAIGILEIVLGETLAC